MTKPISPLTLLGLLMISCILVIVFILWPLLAVTFETGLLVGVFFHSAHNSSSKLLTDKEEQKF
jgi:hypothetical protein